MIMLREIVLGSIIIGAFIFGAILILVCLLRWLLYETTRVERKPRAERPLDKEESVGSLETSSSGNERPEVGEISGEGSTTAPEPPAPPKPPTAPKQEPKKPEEKKPDGQPKPKFNVVDDFDLGDGGGDDGENSEIVRRFFLGVS